MERCVNKKAKKNCEKCCAWWTKEGGKEFQKSIGLHVKMETKREKKDN